MQSIITRTADFINNVMIPDALAIGQFNKPWSEIGTGLSDKCVLSYGAFPDIANDFGEKSSLMPGGAVINGDFNNVLPVDLVDPQQVQEFVDHARIDIPTIRSGVIRSMASPTRGTTPAMSKAAIPTFSS